MPLAARIDEPSDPIGGLYLSGQALELQSSATVSILSWISGGASLALLSTINIGTAVFIVPENVVCELTDDLFHFYLEQIEAVTTFSMNVNQNFTEQLLAWEDPTGVDPGDSEARLNSLEQELALSTTNPTFYKEFSYTGEDLVGYTIYTDATKTTQLFDVSFTFSSGQLTQKVITRASDGQVLTVTYGYTGDQLTSQSRSIT